MIQGNEKVKEQLRDYYTNKFDLGDARKVLGLSNFQNREFGFIDLNKGRFFRNYSFPSPTAFHEFLIDRTPLSVYAGAVFDNPPTKHSRIESLIWKSREFIIDIDLTDYDDVRKCGCRGKDKMCTFCWELIRTAVYFIQDTLENDFGFKKIIWTFSGRRGVHAWIIDERAALFDRRQRTAIIEYMTLIKGKGDTAKLLKVPNHNPYYSERVLNTVIRPFFKSATKAQLTDLGFPESRAREIVSRIKNYGLTELTWENLIFKDTIKVSKKSIFNLLLMNRFPRFDAKVSIDLNRLLRLPGSVHGNSGKVCQIMTFNELLNFDPLIDAIQIFDPVDQQSLKQ